MDEEETTTPAAHTAKADNVKGANGGGIGKFNDVEELYRAYERLEAEFTRRSQKLRALEAGLAENCDKARNGAPQNSAGGEIVPPRSGDDAAGGDGVPTETDTDENKPDGVFRPHGEEAETHGERTIKSAANFCRGAAVSVPPFKPRTLAEAGELAEKYLKGEI